MKIWIVFQGQYSDRSTAAVFDNAQATEAYYENNRRRDSYGPDMDIEEWEVGSECRLITERQVWQTYMDRGGVATGTMRGFFCAEPTAASRCPNSDEPEEPCLIPNIYRGSRTCDLYVKTYATSAEHVVKIANEIRAQMIASGEWDKREQEENELREKRGF